MLHDAGSAWLRTAARQPCNFVLAQHPTGCQQCSQALQATARRQAALQAPGVRVRCCRAERSTCGCNETQMLEGLGFRG